MPSLAHVSLHNNAGLGDYRLAVVHASMYLAGSNRAPGLITVDARRVTIDERVAAAEFDRKRW